jgi:hypothetical protein
MWICAGARASLIYAAGRVSEKRDARDGRELHRAVAQHRESAGDTAARRLTNICAA